MAKRIKFPLEMADGSQVRNLDELREHFDLETVLEYYKSGRLLTWLRDRYFDDEAAALGELDEQSPDFQQKLCGIFGVPYTGEAIDLEEISRRQERLERLRTFTDEAEFIDHIDQVAFDQEDLADLLDEEETTIYLCGEKFTVPASRKGVKYVGINSPSVHISGKLPENADELGIEFGNCNVDNLAVPDKSSLIDAHAQTPFTTGFCTDKVTGDFVDSIEGYDKGFWRFSLSGLTLAQETANFIIYTRTACSEDDYHEFQFHDFQILFDKRTGESKRLPENFPTWRSGIYDFELKACVDGDRVFYFEKDKYKNCGWQGDIWTIDLAEVTLPQKLFPLSWDQKNISACNGHIAYVDQDIGPAVYDLESKAISKIPVKEGECRAIYAVADGVYFSVDNYPTYTMNFYDYASKKSCKIFQTDMEILRIYHVENGKKFYCLFYNYDNHQATTKTDSHVVGIINYDETSNKEKLTPSKVLDVMGTMDTLFDTTEVHAYHDGIVFVAKGGIIEFVDYQTGEIKKISADAHKHVYVKGGLFSKSASWDEAVSFNRIGNWIIYNMNDDYDKRCRVSLEHPGEIIFIPKYIPGSTEKTNFMKRTYDIPEIKIE